MVENVSFFLRVLKYMIFKRRERTERDNFVIQKYLVVKEKILSVIFETLKLCIWKDQVNLIFS